MNRKFDPVGAKLDGWGEDVMENIMDFDGVFERLHNKYSGSVQMEPEMELLFTLGTSAFMFHLQHSLFKTAMPELGGVLRENPNLVQSLFGAVKEAAKRGGQSPMASNDSTSNMKSPGLDFGALLGQMGIGSEGLAGFAKSMGQPPPSAQFTRESKEPPVNELFRKMMSASEQDDNISITSHDSGLSERSIGHAIISPVKRKGGTTNVIKL